MDWASLRKASPATVSFTLRRVRSKSWTPTSASSAWICALRAGWERWRRREAWMKLSRSATAQKERRCRISMDGLGFSGYGGGVNDVGNLEDGFGKAVLGDVEHGVSDLLGGGDVAGEGGFHQEENGVENVVEELVELCFGADAVEGLDESGAKHVGGAEGEFEDVI